MLVLGGDQFHSGRSQFSQQLRNHRLQVEPGSTLPQRDKLLCAQFRSQLFPKIGQRRPVGHPTVGRDLPGLAARPLVRASPPAPQPAVDRTCWMIGILNGASGATRAFGTNIDKNCRYQAP